MYCILCTVYRILCPCDLISVDGVIYATPCPGGSSPPDPAGGRLPPSKYFCLILIPGLDPSRGLQQSLAQGLWEDDAPCLDPNGDLQQSQAHDLEIISLTKRESIFDFYPRCDLTAPAVILSTCCRKVVGERTLETSRAPRNGAVATTSSFDPADR